MRIATLIKVAHLRGVLLAACLMASGMTYNNAAKAQFHGDPDAVFQWAIYDCNCWDQVDCYNNCLIIYP